MSFIENYITDIVITLGLFLIVLATFLTFGFNVGLYTLGLILFLIGVYVLITTPTDNRGR